MIATFVHIVGLIKFYSTQIILLDLLNVIFVVIICLHVGLSL